MFNRWYAYAMANIGRVVIKIAMPPE
jgi:hypothetical protein